ncbi:alpha/beta hydrolase [Azoarcus sp. L1K30]|uniref:alpha/beta fold hydrolase n=1 Tax=Azoarcus sp. L1K30 TaxID=2820277 RepID=UPI001B82C414|nr:alpha/beta hydrolase [Azoarcus sp. L1K30]MBR0567982.1 alpha/beta hydrolase [Azoarcus sp. L1K30]
MATWIFLRGLTREQRHWGHFIDTFRRTLPSADVVTLDLPGNGDLNRQISPTDVRQLARFAHERSAGIGLSPPYNLLAMSLGAMVAVSWADAYPQDIARCVLINTSMRPFSPFHHRLRPHTYWPLLRLALTVRDPRRHASAILQLTSRHHANDPAIVDEWSRIHDDHPVSTRNAMRQLIAAARFHAPPRKPAAEMLLLAAAGDMLVNPACSAALAAAWDCPLRQHPTAGHDLPLDDGEWVATQVADWLAPANGTARKRIKT